VAELSEKLRQIPKVDQILSEEAVRPYLERFPKRLVLKSIRNSLDQVRSELKEGRLQELSPQVLLRRIVENLKRDTRPNLRRVINGTGVILHTNLGRAPLCERALERLLEVGRFYSNLEYDLKEGRRGHRYSHVEELLKELTGAEAVTVVNNNAGAVLLALNTLAQGKEVIVSRGELVEIGGSFRIPEVMSKSGAILKEVGTTNRTHLWDYQRAIGPDTALLLKVHTSNYKILGFTSEVSLEELVDLGHRHNLLVMMDLGSGLLLDLSAWGLRDEPTVKGVLQAGADVVTFSGDKLLGGPQAGIILGRKDLIEAMRKNPLSRALRVDKLTLSALEGTLLTYLDEERAFKEIPHLRMITTSVVELKKRALKLKRLITQRVQENLKVQLVPERSKIGGGSFPLSDLPTWALAIRHERMEVEKIEERLREWEPPIIVRLSEGHLIIDVRTLFEEDLPLIAEALASVLKEE